MDHRDSASLRSDINELLIQAAGLVTATPLALPGSAHKPPSVVIDRVALDRVIVEVAAAERLVDDRLSAGDALLGRVRVTLGSLHATRCVRFGWSEEDRAEGVRAFRAARAAGHLTADTDPNAVMLFVVSLVPTAVANQGSTELFGPIMAVAQQLQARGQIVDDLVEMRGLLDEIAAARPDDPRVAQLVMAVRPLSAVLELLQDLTSGTGFTMNRIHELVRMLPSAPSQQLGAIVNTLIEHGGDLERQLQAGPAPTREEDPDDDLLWEDLTMLVELSVPGAISASAFTHLNETYENAGREDARNAAIAAIGRLTAAKRTNDRQEMDKALENLHAALSSPNGDGMSWLLTSVLPALLSTAAESHGNLSDAAKALELLERGQPAPDRLNTVRSALAYNMRFAEAWEAEDDDTLERLLAELVDTARITQADGEGSFLVPMQLALSELALAARRGDIESGRQAVEHLQVALDQRTPESVRPLVETVRSATAVIAAALGRQPDELAEAVDAARGSLTLSHGPYDRIVHGHVAIASGLMAHFLIADEPAKSQALREAIHELEQAREAMTERTGPAIAGQVLWSLADAYRARGDSGLDDVHRAVALTRDSLRIVAEDVLFQQGTEHGLQAARAGATRGLRAAGWALEGGHVEETMECLEWGRALVLRAAAAAGTVPERLRAAREPELAEQWEQSAPALPHQGSTQDAAADYLHLPSRLRRRALDALHEWETNADGKQRSLLTVPVMSDIADHLDRAGLDALAYLVPGTGADGRVFTILRDGSTRTLPLPGRAPFENYLDSSVQRYQRLRGESTARDLAAVVPRWRHSLDELCDWAGTAVLDPLIAALPVAPTPDAPGRVVLIPCGSLGTVPWHAARIAATPATAGLGRPPRACDVLVVSYAASAEELLRSLDRARRPYSTDPVLVVDPSRTLRYAAAEAVAVRGAYLPGARMMGTADGLDAEAPGTPEQVQAALAGDGDRAPASTVQIIAHGTASTRPTASRLLLAHPDGMAPGSGTRRGEAGPEHLTVAGILDASRPGTGGGFASLVVLDGCETDLSSRDHDEALTLTTAFVARGATDVIGSRWAVDDWSAAVCMVVFHHYLAAGGHSPAEALRAAQRWMLGPAREPIRGLTEDLLEPMTTPLHAVANWAPFIHQGNARP